MDFISEIKQLQKCLAEVDLYSAPRHQSSSGFTEFLVLKFQNLKIKMYQEKGHAMPHLHIDYGKSHHVASFSIKPAKRIEGSLSTKYDRTISEWISSNHDALVEIWKKLQDGGDPETLLPKLKESA